MLYLSLLHRPCAAARGGADYESELGRFQGSEALDTSFFRESWQARRRPHRARLTALCHTAVL